jgi:NADPH:quinone reductase
MHHTFSRTNFNRIGATQLRYVEASQFGGPEVLTVIEKETPTPAEGELLVEVQAAGINYADVAARSGHYPAVTKAPFALGFEIAGVVKAVGKHVEGFKVGDSVAALTLAGGGYASHILIPAATAIPFPKQLDPALAAAILLQGLTAYILLDRAQVKSGDAVLIAAAAGGVGGLAVQLAKLRGAKVIALASESKLELVKSLGADHAFDYGKRGWSAQVLDVTELQGVQVFLDSIGDLATEAFSVLGQFARWIIYGVRSDKQNAFPVNMLWPMIEKNISLMGFNLGGNLDRVPSPLKDLFKFAIDGSIKVEITKYPLAEASIAHADFEGRNTTGKLVLIP